MFFNKDKSPASSPRSEPAPSLRDDASEALETTAALLRSLGRHAFDIEGRTREEIAETFERWARTLLLGDMTRPVRSADGTLRRDWGGVRRFVEAHRREEKLYVEQALTNLRDAVRELVRTTTYSIRTDRAHDERLSEELDSLDRALVVNDHEEVRATAERTSRLARQQIEFHRTRELETIQALEGTIRALRAELDHSRKAATTDALTQVYNRAALDLHLQDVTDQALLSASPACLVMVDLDHFKAINDTFGHVVGDEVLKQVADTIVRSFLRREDFVARYGGEEFCVVCEHASFEPTRERAERLRKAVMGLKIGGRPISLSVSFGIAELARGEAPHAWVARADAALYRAKQKGRNRISVAPRASEEPKPTREIIEGFPLLGGARRGEAPELSGHLHPGSDPGPPKTVR
ncbi:MAG: hypothetical protein B6A08_10710 [Sorangiineae bacterium NIC37A_2]|jgi:diguanylate cyclase|nr:MAG: hypothetical protein B6A08_10710 [Sorangiineae bacterium NIC37A_2]